MSKSSILTIMSSEYDPSTVSGLISIFKISKAKIKFPIVLESGCCKSVLIIRGFDDFPTNSMECECKKIYLIKLVGPKHDKEKSSSFFPKEYPSN